jgi:hypothetical protein
MLRSAMILALSLALPAVAVAAPARLSDSQMDVVTAGFTAVTNATASASGNDVKVKARSVTRVREVRNGKAIKIIAKVRIKASACCGDEADVAALATATGEGDIVRQRSRSFEFEKRNGKKVAKSFAKVVVIEFNHE